jgi:hypothetical protein
MEVYEEIFCESRDFGYKMWGADCVYYRLKDSILEKDNVLFLSGSKFLTI